MYGIIPDMIPLQIFYKGFYLNFILILNAASFNYRKVIEIIIQDLSSNFLFVWVSNMINIRIASKLIFEKHFFIRMTFSLEKFLLS